MILLLKKRNEVIIKMHEKIKIIFETYFSSSSIIFTNDIEFFLFIINERRKNNDKSKADKTDSQN